MKKVSLYGVICAASLIIRQFVLPNPFECFGENAVIYNWIAEPILHVAAFSLVGLVYCRGSLPAWGSFLYLITYSILVGVLMLLSIFKYAWWWDLIVTIVLIAIVITIIIIINKVQEDSDYYN